MALDRFVWLGSDRPSRDEIASALERYVRGLATEVKWSGDRWLVTLPGVPSPLAHGASAQTETAWAESATNADGTPRQRWIEVWLGEDSIDVITREADQITNAIAAGFAAICERAWGKTKACPVPSIVTVRR